MSWSQWAGGEPLCRVSHLQAFEQYVLDALEEQLVKPLRTDVENDLRLRIHTKNLEFMTTPNPKKESARQLRPTYLTSSLKQVLTNGKKRSFSVCIEWSASKEASMFT